MELSYSLAVTLAVLAVLCCVVLFLTLKYDNALFFVVFIIMTLLFLTGAIANFVSVSQNRKAVSNGTVTYKVMFGDEVHEEDLYNVRSRYYYDTNYELKYITSNSNLLVYRDGENVGSSSDYTIIKEEESHD